MKLKYILGSLLSAVLFVGCSDDKTIGTYGNLSEDDTFVVLSADGGDATITINAVGEWAFDEIFSTTKTVDGQKVTTHHPLPTWLTASAVSGSGNTQVTFHADATNGGREAELRLTIDGKKQFVKVMDEQFGVAEENIQFETISATIGSEMRRDAVLATLLALVCMLAYIWFRFKDVRFGAASVIALLHDALVVVACYAITRISVGGTFIACILTIIGYSINATIVIFDRVRENLRIMGKADLNDVVNTSVTQTLSRSVFTSLTTFMFVLYLLGVPSIKDFALPLMVGVICGTYSSIFLAGNLWYVFRQIAVNKAAAAEPEKASSEADGQSAGSKKSGKKKKN